jgi:hypothetical protein
MVSGYLAGPMTRALLAVIPLVAVACGSASPPPAVPREVPPAAAVLAPAVAPDVDLRDGAGKTALVGGRAVAMDGEPEGLAWPALRAAVGRKPGDHSPLTLAVARDVPTSAVMRAVWTLRDADLRLQTLDAGGVARVLELRPRPDAPSIAGCHLAVFVGANGDLRVASPGGARTVTGPDAPASLVRALTSERTRCEIRYVAFGAETPDAPWASIFDVAEAIDRAKAAGDARYVLGEPVHLAAR